MQLEISESIGFISKVFHSVPVESFNYWLFIYHGVFGKPFSSNMPPVVQALIGQIMQNI